MFTTPHCCETGMFSRTSLLFGVFSHVCLLISFAKLGIFFNATSVTTTAVVLLIIIIMIIIIIVIVMKMIIEIVIMITIPNNDNDKKNHDDTTQRKRKTGEKIPGFCEEIHNVLFRL